MEFRRARADDFPAILRLQAANYIRNLRAGERDQGFLSAEFTLEQIAEIANDLGIIVAASGDSVLGFLCASRRNFDHSSPIVARMVQEFDRIEYRGMPLQSYGYFLYGPVCIDGAHRGSGLLRGLYEALKKEVSGRFNAGVAFVAEANPHSLRAHVRGLGMERLGNFELKGSVYIILAFVVP